MTDKTYKQISKKLEKVCNALTEMMQKHQPDEIFEVLITGAPPEDVELIALFSLNMQKQFVQKMMDIVYQTDEECYSNAEICSTCGDKETCPDRKDQLWMR